MSDLIERLRGSVAQEIFEVGFIAAWSNASIENGPPFALSDDLFEKEFGLSFEASPDGMEALRKFEAQQSEIARLREALEPFALASIEGVVKPDEQDHVSIVTCGRFFHRARAALEQSHD